MTDHATTPRPAQSRGGCAIEFAGASFELLPDRAISWAARRALLVADLHLGKPASFRAGGAPIPESVTEADLSRLSRLIDLHRPDQLVVLGDLAHDRAAWRPATLRAFAAWRGLHPHLGITLVRGNHDRRASDPPRNLDIRCVEPGFRMGSIELHHDPATVGEAPALCGHLHPGVTLHHARGLHALRAPCFWFSPRLGVLPSFGTFTGCAPVRPRASDRIFAIGDGRVLEATLA